MCTISYKVFVSTRDSESAKPNKKKTIQKVSKILERNQKPGNNLSNVHDCLNLQ